MAKKKKAAPMIKPKGKGPMKRTLTSVFNTIGKDDDVFQCKKIAGTGLAMGGITHWNVKWAGYGTKDNT